MGVELVRDRSTLEPADRRRPTELVRAHEATAAVLLSTDGPLHNVIKIKPPMVFTTGDAETVVAGLREVLAGL